MEEAKAVSSGSSGGSLPPAPGTLPKWHPDCSHWEEGCSDPLGTILSQAVEHYHSFPSAYVDFQSAEEENRQTACAVTALSSCVHENLVRFPELFEKEFGEAITVGFRKNLSSLGQGQMEFLDEWNDRFSNGIVSRIMEKAEESSYPLCVQRAGSSYSYFHELTAEFPPVVFINSAFEQTFGWNISQLRSLGISVAHLCERCRLGSAIYASMQTCMCTDVEPHWDTPVTFRVPRFSEMCVDGSFAQCCSHIAVIRSPFMTPVYYVMLFSPS